MNLLWTDFAWQDYLHWQTADPKMIDKINALVKDIQRTPFKELGKPEPLRGNLAGWWSRRITGDHRLVYRVRSKDDAKLVEIAASRYHY